jgi:hypothetical protein
MPQLCGSESCTLKLNTRAVRRPDPANAVRTKSVACCLDAVATQTSERGVVEAPGSRRLDSVQNALGMPPGIHWTAPDWLTSPRAARSRSRAGVSAQAPGFQIKLVNIGEAPGGTGKGRLLP